MKRHFYTRHGLSWRIYVEETETRLLEVGTWLPVGKPDEAEPIVRRVVQLLNVYGSDDHDRA